MGICMTTPAIGGIEIKIVTHPIVTMAFRTGHLLMGTLELIRQLLMKDPIILPIRVQSKP
jgi:hypothetical protein